MAQQNDYEFLIVESYVPANTAGLHGRVHVRPVAGQRYPTTLQVECSKELTRRYAVGTKFRLKVKLTDREGGKPFLYSSWRWSYEVVA